MKSVAPVAAFACVVGSFASPDIIQPRVMNEVGGWTYQGCAQDNVNNRRTFFWKTSFGQDLTPERCLQRCAEYGYMAAGIKLGEECHCGDPANLQTARANFVGDKKCNDPCSGKKSLACGGSGHLTTYLWKGDPFYSWKYAEAGSPDAGSYDFLIGGLCVPLMASQAVNGKIMFLEKWPTGAPNTTGAYELDLSLVDDLENAWREMHVDTDVFCSAGITLPDKAGRQLTVGGWWGNDTFGVRIRTPRGSPGTPGKGDDWQENVDLLQLQNGRWYPSAMIMPNGSVLVLGGEEYEKGPPVPTLEILPPTGASPIRLDWLESPRSNPRPRSNHLYPFLAVLPSGGILVTHWNRARILDASTFDTVKILPKIPGAVNDPNAGRTEPLEGAAVLLPQHAPYHKPLGILICGGSTLESNDALDNCVSIFPDAPDPKWTIERMPSPRVLPSIAPLPDGTYLILNGAHHGKGGFRLARDPNLTVLLYDPVKPVGNRFTVMGNATVARMYHSEAITLLDGRVLVSGSDPEDARYPQEYRVETFSPPYLLKGRPRPTFELDTTDWSYGDAISFRLGSATRNKGIRVSMLGSVFSTHGNAMGARTLFPEVSCSGKFCTVIVPPNEHICPPGWYQFFVLDGHGTPAIGVYIRVGGDPAAVGNWPEGPDFTRPGV